MIKINVAGDFYISPSYLGQELFSAGILKFFSESDINILNLECPIVKNPNDNKIKKTGPHLYTTKDIIQYLKKLSVEYVTLANNHIMDFGSEGLLNTLDICQANTIKTVGAGVNIHEAEKPSIIDLQGIKIAVVNFCENEWSIATDEDAGANPLDLIENFKQIQSARMNSDFVILIIHGGHEYYHLPSPRMVKLYRFFADYGADIIIGHHTHCISGYEIYNNVPIFYSLGNMLFTRQNNIPDWYRGLLLQLQIDQNKKLNWELIPVTQSIDNYYLDFTNGEELTDTELAIKEYSDIIRDHDALIQNWNTYVSANIKKLTLFSPFNLLPRSYLKRGLNRVYLNSGFLRKKSAKPLLNSMRCESHHELLIELLSKEV